MQELWTLLASASASGTGVPVQLLEEKQAELLKKREAEAEMAVSRRR
jgi:hypothetical protein